MKRLHIIYSYKLTEVNELPKAVKSMTIAMCLVWKDKNSIHDKFYIESNISECGV